MKSNFEELIKLKKDKLKALNDMLNNNMKLEKIINDDDSERIMKSLELDNHYMRVIDNIDKKIDEAINVIDKDSDFSNEKIFLEIDNEIKNTLLKIQSIAEDNKKLIVKEMDSSQLKFKNVRKSVKALKIYNQNSRV